MRTRVFCAVLSLSALCLVLSTQPAESQKRGGFTPGGGTPGGGMPGGGFGGGGKSFGGGGKSFGGGGKSFGGGGMLGNSDPSKIFDMLSKGRGFFLINETRSMRDGLAKYAEENRISNGQITKDQFVTYWNTRGPGAMTRPTTPGTDSKGPVPPTGPGAPPMVPGMDRNEALSAWAESEFKRRDRNDDSYLNTDEIPEALRGEFSKWDKNSDNLISMNEFRAYFQDRFQSGTRGDLDAPSTTVTRIIEDEELDLRPTVFRAGKLPKELPSWFLELDTDKDGQVALYEWRAARKDLEDYRSMDRNDDGLLTPEETLRHQGLAKASTTSPSFSSSSLSAGSGGERPRWGEGSKWGGGGDRGKGGFKFEFKRPK